MNSLASALTHLMTEKRINSAELARQTGSNQPAIYRIMTGETINPQVFTLAPIAQYFGVSIEQLLGLTPLHQQNTFSSSALHEATNKLSSIKTVANVLCEFLPRLIEGYQKAIAANLIDETVSSEILPLLTMNTFQLFESAQHVQELLTNTTPQNL